MVSQRDWETAHREVIERGRARAGDPPTAEQIDAMARGELSDADADEVRERLAYYPELAVALAEDDDAQDQRPLLTPGDLAADWDLLRQRMSPVASAHVAANLQMAPARVSWLILLPVATTLLFGALFVGTLVSNRKLREDLRQPQGQLERISLFENTARGPSSTISIAPRPSATSILLVFTVLDNVRPETARATIRDLDTKPARVVWSGTITRAGDGTFPLVVPRSFLISQNYQVDLAVGDRVFATYQFWLPNDDASLPLGR